MTRLLLLRHAESEWNAVGRWQGMADPPLSRRGVHQAAQVAPRLRPYGFSAVVSSDLRRARVTAELVAAGLGLAANLAVDPGLREYDVGAWSGRTRAEIEAQWPGAIEDWRAGRLAATPAGERRDAFVARVTASIERIAAAWPGEAVLVVTHGGVIGVLAHSLGAEPKRVPHLAGRWIDAGPLGLEVGAELTLLEPTSNTADESTDLSPSPVLDTGRR